MSRDTIAEQQADLVRQLLDDEQPTPDGFDERGVRATRHVLHHKAEDSRRRAHRQQPIPAARSWWRRLINWRRQ